MANQRFYAVYFMGLSVEHKAFTVHHRIHVAVQSSFVTVEPFHILQFGVFVELIEESIRSQILRQR